MGVVGALVSVTGAAGALAVAALTDPPAGAAAALPPCAAERAARTSGAPYRCSTGATELVLAGEGRRFTVGPTSARVLGSTRSGRTLRVRLWIAQREAEALRVPVGRRQVYVRLARRTVYPAGIAVVERRGRAALLTVRFHLTRAQDAARDRGAAAAVAVVPWDQLGRRRPERLAVVHLGPSSP